MYQLTKATLWPQWASRCKQSLSTAIDTVRIISFPTSTATVSTHKEGSMAAVYTITVPGTRRSVIISEVSWFQKTCHSNCSGTSLIRTSCTYCCSKYLYLCTFLGPWIRTIGHFLLSKGCLDTTMPTLFLMAEGCRVDIPDWVLIQRYFSLLTTTHSLHWAVTYHIVMGRISWTLSHRDNQASQPRAT